MLLLHICLLYTSQWELEFVPDGTSAKAKVYAAGRLDKTASEEFAKSFADRVGIEFPDTYYYDDTIIFANHSTGDFLNINQRDGSWEYKIDTDTAPTFDVNASEIKPAELSGLLAEWGINIPEEAGFSVEPFGEDGKYTCLLDTSRGKAEYRSNTRKARR